MSKSDSSELKAASNSKVSQWLESTGLSLADFEWGQENMEHEEGSEGSLDGWTTASKRNRVRACHCYPLIPAYRVAQNRPFAQSSHMVQNHTCW